MVFSQPRDMGDSPSVMGELEVISGLLTVMLLPSPTNMSVGEPLVARKSSTTTSSGILTGIHSDFNCRFGVNLNRAKNSFRDTQLNPEGRREDKMISHRQMLNC